MRIIFETENKEYRIVELADEACTMDDLKGDVYNPKINPDIDPAELKRQENEFEDLVNREGVFGYVLQRWNATSGVGYEHVDSCFGFVGQYTPTETTFDHYIVNEMKDQIPNETKQRGTK